MDQIKFETVIAGILYMAIVVRWFRIINKYHAQVLLKDMSYEYKDHPVFKGLLYGRAAVLAFIAPVVSLARPSYFSVFLEGLKFQEQAKVGMQRN